MDATNERQALMGLLARAPLAAIEATSARLALPASEPIRAPETGLVTVRGRIGGGGAQFNLGEATVTRCSVKLATGEIGHAYALGRDAEKARLSAVLDAAFQNKTLAPQVRSHVLEPLLAQQAETDGRRAEESAATKVDFFTMVRGED